MRRSVSLIFSVLLTLLWLPAGAQDARGALDAAAAAMVHGGVDPMEKLVEAARLPH